jgi:hypothetical protein
MAKQDIRTRVDLWKGMQWSHGLTPKDVWLCFAGMATWRFSSRRKVMKSLRIGTGRKHGGFLVVERWWNHYALVQGTNLCRVNNCHGSRAYTYKWPVIHIGLVGIGFVGVFFTDKNRVVKIARSSSEMVLRSTEHTMIYPGSGLFLEVIALRPAIWYWGWTGVTKGWAESSRSSRGEGENGSRTPWLKGRGPFI